MSISSPDPSALGANQRSLPDVQGFSDDRRVAINKVGVRNVKLPIDVRSPGGSPATTVATADMYVSLPADRKGTHMSRFLEILQAWDEPMDPATAVAICRTIRERLDAEDAYLDLAFPYFIRKLAPVSQKPGLIDYDVRIEAASHATGDDVVLAVSAAATSLCPCSKEISAFGAHNQRCRIEARVRFDGDLHIEDLAEIVESAASCEVYAVLKRPDEKFVTEEAFKNPKFVEDIIRDLATALERDDRITWFHISSQNFESIHGHDAYAEIERTTDRGRASE